MKQHIKPLSVVLAAILSLILFTTVKGEKNMSTENSENPVVVIETNLGDISVELDAKNAPNTTANFLAYVDDGYFNDTIFHRVIPGFMIQGGGLTADMRDKPSNRAPIENEANNGLKNDRGTIAMARTNDPHSATSQFFINLKDNDFLNFRNESMQGWGYAVFGKVTDGMDVVDKIAAVPTGNKGGHQDVPLETVVIKTIRRQ
jgi:peptidyl-prolyl cis-trans isomerase B (cyclophilin B)